MAHTHNILYSKSRWTYWRSEYLGNDTV